MHGDPDAIAGDPYDRRIFILSHSAPNATVLDAGSGSVLGTIDLGGEPEQAVSDGRGRLFVDLENEAAIAVVDVRAMKVSARYHLTGTAAECAGLAIDAQNGILFASCREPRVMVVVRAADGKILATFPIGDDSDGAVFNPNTMEAFSAQIDGTLSIVKEHSPTTFSLEQTLHTKAGAKTLTLDPKTNRIFLITGDFTPPPPGQRRPRMVPRSSRFSWWAAKCPRLRPYGICRGRRPAARRRSGAYGAHDLAHEDQVVAALVLRVRLALEVCQHVGQPGAPPKPGVCATSSHLSVCERAKRVERCCCGWPSTFTA